MKANAPKKIYLTKLMLFAAPTISSSDNDVEYTRTDAVIDFLKDCSTYEDFNGNTCVDEDLFNTMVEDFRKYIEGK